MWSYKVGDSGLLGEMVGPCFFYDGHEYLGEISIELYVYMPSFKYYIVQNFVDQARAIFLGILMGFSA